MVVYTPNNNPGVAGRKQGDHSHGTWTIMGNSSNQIVSTPILMALLTNYSVAH
jgi:hypothetical protein